MDGTDTQQKLRIGYCLNDRLAPIAAAIIQNLRNNVRMIEELPSVAIEAMMDHARENDRLDNPRTEVDRQYQNVRRALIKYAAAVLKATRKRENRLLNGITGLELPDDEPEPGDPGV